MKKTVIVSSIELLDTLYRLERPDYSFLGPEETTSGAWEILDWSRQKFMEIRTREALSPTQFEELLLAMEFAFDQGLRTGRAEGKRAALYQIQALDDDRMAEIADLDCDPVGGHENEPST